MSRNKIAHQCLYNRWMQCPSSDSDSENTREA